MTSKNSKNTVLKKGARLVQKGDYEGAIKHYNSALNYDPLHAWYGKGLLYVKLGDEKQALNYFNRALLNMDFVPALVERGKLFRRIKQYESALKSFDRALKVSPRNPYILYEKAHLLKEIKDYDGALLILDEVISLMPGLYLAWHDKGDIYLLEDKTDEAYELYSQALEINPEFFPSWVGMGLTFQELQQFPDAITCYNNANDLNSNYNYSNLLMANAYLSLKDYETALVYIDEFKDNEPGSSDAWYEKGNILCRAGEFKDGLLCLDKSTSNRPESFYVWFTKGKFLINQGNYDEARECFEKSLELNEDFLRAWESIALTFSLSGDKEKYYKCRDFINTEFMDHTATEAIENQLNDYYKVKYMESLPQSFTTDFEEENVMETGKELELLKELDKERKGDFVPEFDVRKRVFYYALTNIPLGLFAVVCAMIYGPILFLIAIAALIFAYKVFMIGQAKYYHFNQQRKLFVTIGIVYGAAMTLCFAVIYLLFKENPDHFLKWLAYHSSRFASEYSIFNGQNPAIPDPFLGFILMVSCFVLMCFAFYIASDPRFIFKYAKGTEPAVYNHYYFY